VSYYLLLLRYRVLVLTNHLLSSFVSYISGTVASGSGKVEAIKTDADRRLLHDQRLREVKKANRQVAIPQSQDNDNDNKSGEDTAAKVVETKTIRQEHVEPDFGVLLTEHERDLKAKSGKSIKSFNKSKSGKSLSKKSRDPPVVTTTKATNPVTSTPEPPVATPVTTTKATNPVTSTLVPPVTTTTTQAPPGTKTSSKSSKVTTTKATNPVTSTPAPPVTTPVTTSQATSTTPGCVKLNLFGGAGTCVSDDECCPCKCIGCSVILSGYFVC